MRRVMTANWSNLLVRAPEISSFNPPSFYGGTSTDQSSQLQQEEKSIKTARALPRHHGNDSKTLFLNPWPKAGEFLGPSGILSFFGSDFFQGKNSHSSKMSEIGKKFKTNLGDQPLPFRENMTWEVDESDHVDPNKTQILTTWLGHASYHVRFPLRNNRTDSDEPSRLNILTDPVFDERCSPFSFMGPKRLTPCPTSVEKMHNAGDKAKVDIILISHNHYDHLSYNTLKEFVTKPKNNSENWKPPHIFVPLGIKEWFVHNFSNTCKGGEENSFSPQTHVHEFDWWEEKIIYLENGERARIICTPAMHGSGRSISMTDRNRTLWCSWTVQGLNPSEKQVLDENTITEATLFFSGDTGYKSIVTKDGLREDYSIDELMPDKPPVSTREEDTCPAFREVYEKLGAPDLALLPIGAYEPRKLFSYVHASPIDTVQIHLDLHSKKSLAMHWGVWRLTTEPFFDPRRLLSVAKQKLGVEEDAFTTPDIGQTVSVPISRT